MIISVKHRFIFIKTRKVAGSSLEKYLIDKLVDKKTDDISIILQPMNILVII